MKSPFKFLDAFDMEDKDVFFGRDLEIKDLYKKVSMSPLLLVYGLSGTGKTSLVSCGLAKNFNGPDWYPFFIRRKKDVNTSLVEELTLATGDRGEESICEKLSFLYDRYLCPLYLIFDQFEEIFILGSQEEQEAFAENLLEIMEAEIPVKIILIMREEYLGDLYQLEQKISTIYDNRLRVETMRREKVKEVLKLSFSKFQIGLEGEDEDRLNQIVDNLSDEKSGIVQLPYLQVYLDMIYKEEFAKEHPGEVFDEENLKPIQITQQEIADFGRIDDVLDRFLRTQLADIPERLKEDYPDVNTKLIENILDGFVTEDGTKRPVQVTEEDGGDNAPNLIHLPEGEIPFFQGVAPPAIPIETFSVILHELVKSRLLRYNEEGMELAHDTLAALVDNRRGHEQRIKKDFQKLYNALQNTNSKLDKQQILTYERYFPILKLDPTLESFIDESVSEVKRKEEAEEFARQEKIRLKEERLQAELKAEQARRTKQRALIRAIGGGLIVSLFFLVIAAVSYFNAVEQRRIAVEQKNKAQRNLKDSYASQSNTVQLKVDDLETRGDNLREREPGLSAEKYEKAIQELDHLIVKITNSEVEFSTDTLMEKYKSLEIKLEEVKEERNLMTTSR